MMDDFNRLSCAVTVYSFHPNQCNAAAWSRTMKRRSSLAILLVAAFYVPEPAFPWGTRAHAVIDRAAVDTLPDDGPVLVRKYADYIAGSASIPDTWRQAFEPFSKIEEDPNHGWFR
jgi:hypothetical protein